MDNSGVLLEGLTFFCHLLSRLVRFAYLCATRFAIRGGWFSGWMRGVGWRLFFLTGGLVEAGRPAACVHRVQSFRCTLYIRSERRACHGQVRSCVQVGRGTHSEDAQPRFGRQEDPQVDWALNRHNIQTPFLVLYVLLMCARCVLQFEVGGLLGKRENC